MLFNSRRVGEGSMNVEELDEIKTSILEKLYHVQCDGIICSKCPLRSDNDDICGITVINKMWD